MNSRLQSLSFCCCAVLLLLRFPINLANAQITNLPPLRITSLVLSGTNATITLDCPTNTICSLEGSDLSQNYWDQFITSAALPHGLTFNVSINPSAPSYFYRVAALPAEQLNLFPSGPLLSSTTVSLPDAFPGSVYSVDISPFTSGSPPYTLSLFGTPPAGIDANLISNGTSNATLQIRSSPAGPITGQRVRFSVQVTDVAQSSVTKTFDLRVVSPPPQILSTQAILKAGAPCNLSLLVTNGTSPLAWSLSGALPQGITFSNGVLSGTPTADAAELHEDGLYTNILSVSDSFTDRVTGQLRQRTSSQPLVTLVRLSFELNIVASRADGPILGGICVGCHGPDFLPDFTSGTALSVINVSAGSGPDCTSSWTYVTPGSTDQSLIYWKVTAPVCGNQMPYGGPYFNLIQIDRLARWILELSGDDTD